MVRDGTSASGVDGVPGEATAGSDAAVAAPLAGGTTSGLTALDRARLGDRGAVRVLVLGREPEEGAASGRLALALRAEGFTVAALGVDRGEAALADGSHHAVVVDLRAVMSLDGGGRGLVERMVTAAPDVPIVVVGPDDGDALAWIDAGADEHVDEVGVTPALLRRTVESAVARVRARDLRRRLEQADRLTTIGQLAAGVAHEVNNPAAFLLMNLRTCREYVGELREVLGDATPGDGTPSAPVALLDEMAEMLDDNVRGVERIVAIVDALRSYVRMDPDQPSSVVIADVCRDAIALVASRVRQHARLELSLDEGARLRVRVDPRRLGKVVVHLVANACDACEAAAGRAPAGGHRIEVAIHRRGEQAVIRIGDTGAGMPSTVRARAFEPFFTTKSRGLGIGLGLAIARDIIERYGGRLELDSEVGRGSTFQISVPLEPPTEAARAAGFASGSGGGAAAVAESTRRRVRQRVLVIDDEVALTNALRRQLRFHHEVTVVNDGAAALTLVEREPFDVVVCDVTMPGMDGVAVRAALARIAPRLAARLIFMTGGVLDDDVRDALLASGAPVLAKPAPISLLLDAIETARAR